MHRSRIVKWLREEDERRLEELWQQADEVRRRCVGEAVHLRGLIEFTNYCVRRCHYCGLRADNLALSRYRMSTAEILECAQQAVQFGYGTVVLQSGEDYGIRTDWLADLVRRIKAQTPLAVTLSVGERCVEDLIAWREAGADRYLLRFETSNRMLYDAIHPPLSGRIPDRFTLLRKLKDLGYETGSGVMIGIPGQTYENLARDIEMFAALDLDMVGVGPFLPHPDTPLGQEEKNNADQVACADQVPNTELMTYKVVALARLVCPLSNIPSTTALATLNLAKGRELGLTRGANVVMPNLTPRVYRERYEIYPSKACIREDVDACCASIKHLIDALGRIVGVGRGDSPNRIRQGGQSHVAERWVR